VKKTAFARNRIGISSFQASPVTKNLPACSMIKNAHPPQNKSEISPKRESAKTIESVLEGDMLVPRVTIVQPTTSPNIDLPKIHGNVGNQAAAIDL